MATSSVEAITQKFQIEKLTEIQKQGLEELSKGKDVFVSTKTGGGKSLIYQAFPIYNSEHERDRILVISPLISIMKEQTHFLRGVGFSADYIGSSPESDNDIASGKVQFIYTSPESVLKNEKWRTHLTNSADIALLVVDEAHTVIQWSEGTKEDEPFREWFGYVGELRSLIKCPTLVITATLSKTSRRKLKHKLALLDCVEIIDSPDRENIKLFVKKVGSGDAIGDVFSWILDDLADKGAAAPRYLLFVSSIAKCGTLMTMCRIHLPKDKVKHINMFHSSTPDDVKELITKDMNNKDGDIRVLIATSSAGMGVNFRGLQNVVHFGPPRDMDSFVQQLGRAGRDGTQSYHLLLYTGQHMSELRPKAKCMEMRTYATNTDRCRRELLLESYNATKNKSLKGHLCCDLCAKQCDCKDDDCEIFKLPYACDIPEYEESDDESDCTWDTSYSTDGDSD